MDCKQQQNKAHCTCLKTECKNHGICCDCIAGHMKSRTFPRCVFKGEFADGRSFETFAAYVREGKL